MAKQKSEAEPETSGAHKSEVSEYLREIIASEESPLALTKRFMDTLAAHVNITDDVRSALWDKFQETVRQGLPLLSSEGVADPYPDLRSAFGPYSWVDCVSRIDLGLEIDHKRLAFLLRAAAEGSAHPPPPPVLQYLGGYLDNGVRRGPKRKDETVIRQRLAHRLFKQKKAALKAQGSGSSNNYAEQAKGWLEDQNKLSPAGLKRVMWPRFKKSK